MTAGWQRWRDGSGECLNGTRHQVGTGLPRPSEPPGALLTADSAMPSDPKNGELAGARQQPAAVCAVGLGWTGGSGGLGVLARAGIGLAAEGHFVAEAAWLADVVADLARCGALAFVVVGSEVLVAHSRVGQQHVRLAHLGVAERDLGFGLAAGAGQPAVAGSFTGLCLAGRDRGLAGVAVAVLVPGAAGLAAGLAVQLPAAGQPARVSRQPLATGLARQVMPIRNQRPARQAGPSAARSA
jgi:hypothetical protein